MQLQKQSLTFLLVGAAFGILLGMLFESRIGEPPAHGSKASRSLDLESPKSVADLDRRLAAIQDALERLSQSNLALEGGSASRNSLTPSAAHDPASNQTMLRLIELLESVKQGFIPNAVDGVRVARGGNIPKNQGALDDYMNRLLFADRNPEEGAYDAVSAELHMMSTVEVLERFGSPDEMELEIGTLRWIYYKYRDGNYPKDQSYLWRLSLHFTDNMLMWMESEFD
ncbi:MAG: hypothetical protein DWQ01_12945 [Planctomycetota bacterium]|nr:MAG: hypothetical protein DWQ01_12945 [Planctomycetota bacterium]